MKAYLLHLERIGRNSSNLARVLLFFPSRRSYERRCKGLRFAMGQDDSSAVTDYGRFDKTHWSMVLQAAQSGAPGPRKPWLRYVGAIGFVRR